MPHPIRSPGTRPRASPSSRSTPPPISTRSTHRDGLPGFAPFTRGPRATMYAGRPWTIRQYAGFSTAEESNAFYRAGARRRAEGPVGRLRPRHPSRLRQRPSARRRRCRQGRRGDRHGRGHEDPVRRHPARQDDRVDDDERRGDPGAGHASSSPARSRASQPAQLSGTIQNDILKEFMVRNTYIYPPEPSMRIVADIIAYTARQHAEIQLDLDLRLSHAGGRGDAGAGARLHPRRRQGICAAPRWRRGWTIDAFAGRLSFFFGIGMNFFMEVAKLRAARTAVVADHGRTSAPKDRRSHDAAHPLPDLGRVAAPSRTRTTTSSAPRSRRWRRCWAAPSRCTPTRFDEAIALPTDFSARIARNTQLDPAAEETGITHVVDPLGGSYYVEALTAASWSTRPGS